MSEMNKILVRSEVPTEHTWALEDMYATKADWEKDLEATKEIAVNAAALAGKLKDSAENLLKYCELDEELGCHLSDVYGYASRMKDQDTTDSVGQAMEAKAMSLYVECSGMTSFAGPEILDIDEETLNGYYEVCPKLCNYRRSLSDLRRCREHILSPELEKLLADAGEMAQTPDTVFSMLSNADLTFPSVKNSAGEEFEVTNGSFIPLMQSPDRSLRKAAFESLYHTYGNVINTSAALINAQVNQLKFFSKARKYNNTLEASLDHTNVPVGVYKNLIAAVHEDIGVLHRYMRLRKKLLGVDELHMYDLYPSLVADADVKISYEKAKEEVLAATAVLGEEYSKTLKHGFESRWVDVYENKGKRSGAYSAGQRVHPYVLMNYKDTLDSEFTLAHEMGHAMHSWLSNKNQRPIDSDYVIFVAEVASTCNESLLMQHLLRKTEDKRTRAYLINYFLEQFRTTLYRQTMFAEFEMMINEASERGESLTADSLNQMYRKLNEFYYGEDVVVDDEIAMEWARIPHFYYNFYVFQYATGFSAAMALSKKILNEGEPAVKDYLNFLSGGCSKDPISLLKGAGVDMGTSQPVHEALAVFDSLLDEMETLMAE
ncbi:MAG: oligoendopeptidase F [Lachnospiraceae bacterium]|nr:oligoendopeptidase F [Lachnospiraceae bacterium]